MQKLYAVQLKPGYRFVLRDHNHYDRMELFGMPYVAVFKSRKQSDDFMRTVIPQINPNFSNVRTNKTHLINETHLIADCSTQTQWSQKLEVFLVHLTEFNLPEPDYLWGDEELVNWWDIICATHDAKSIEHIRQTLQLPHWGENPFRNASVYTDPDNLILDYYPPLAWLSDFAKACQFPVPILVPSCIQIWWTEYFPQMTPEQQRALWRWFDPEPFFITEIELEGDLPCSLA
jgi:hypothetical protein